MARSWWMVVALLLVVSLMITQASSEVVDGLEASNTRSLLTIDCGSKCAYRCSKSWKQKMCLRMCNICCAKCACVPDGPKASKASCPCYDKLTNNKGKPKCP